MAGDVVGEPDDGAEAGELLAAGVPDVAPLGVVGVLAFPGALVPADAAGAGELVGDRPPPGGVAEPPLVPGADVLLLAGVDIVGAPFGLGPAMELLLG